MWNMWQNFHPNLAIRSTENMLSKLKKLHKIPFEKKTF